LANIPCKVMASEKPLNFYIFGSPVTMSPSPDIHGAGFKVNGSPHKYSRFDTPNVDEVFQQLKRDDCGGGSVTIPHKETIKKYMDELTESARIIGAVNTVTKVNGKFRGDNTDWIGIKNQVEMRMREQGRGASALCGLLCGAGGTARAAAYALKQMGAKKVLIFNRTVSRAKELAQEFGFEACGDLDVLKSLEALHVVIDTLPGSSEFVLPDAAVSVLRRCRPVVLEAAYIPRRTAFLSQALAANCEVVEGIEMLFEQGCAQCQIWTGKPAPRLEIAEALLQALFTPGSSHPAHAKMEPYSDLPKSLVLEARGRSRSGALVVQDLCCTPLRQLAKLATRICSN